MGQPEQAGVEQRDLPFALPAQQPSRQGAEPDHPNGDDHADELGALLPGEDAKHDAAHTDHGQSGSDAVDLPRARIRDIAYQPDLSEHHRDDHDLEHESDAPRQIRRDEAAEQRPDSGGDRGSGADQGIRPFHRGALEVPMNQGLHRWQQQRRAKPPDDRPEHEDRGQALCQRHGECADRVRDQANDVRAFAPDEVGHLAACQDERGRHERLDCDRCLHAADGRVEVVHDCRNRHVHQRGVYDQHEHRRREKHRKAGAASWRTGILRAGVGRHRTETLLGRGTGGMPHHTN